MPAVSYYYVKLGGGENRKMKGFGGKLSLCQTHPLSNYSNMLSS